MIFTMTLVLKDGVADSTSETVLPIYLNRPNMVSQELKIQERKLLNLYISNVNSFDFDLKTDIYDTLSVKW